jgi:hypothetical protein
MFGEAFPIKYRICVRYSCSQISLLMEAYRRCLLHKEVSCLIYFNTPFLVTILLLLHCATFLCYRTKSENRVSRFEKTVRFCLLFAHCPTACSLCHTCIPTYIDFVADTFVSLFFHKLCWDVLVQPCT